MISIILQQEEADAVERILDLILTNEQAANAVFRDGAERRNVVRASKKLHWAKTKEAAA
jgi:hypothetical protein